MRHKLVNFTRGSQLIGHFGREDTVLAVSAQLERAAPWAWRKPVFA